MKKTVLAIILACGLFGCLSAPVSKEIEGITVQETTKGKVTTITFWDSYQGSTRVPKTLPYTTEEERTKAHEILLKEAEERKTWNYALYWGSL
jgi:hypothetical protein